MKKYFEFTEKTLHYLFQNIGLGRLVSLFVIVETEKKEKLAINVKRIISVNSIRITKKSVNSSDKYYKLIRSNLFSSW